MWRSFACALGLRTTHSFAAGRALVLAPPGPRATPPALDVALVRLCPRALQGAVIGCCWSRSYARALGPRTVSPSADAALVGLQLAPLGLAQRCHLPLVVPVCLRPWASLGATGSDAALECLRPRISPTQPFAVARARVIGPPGIAQRHQHLMSRSCACALGPRTTSPAADVAFVCLRHQALLVAIICRRSRS